MAGGPPRPQWLLHLQLPAASSGLRWFPDIASLYPLLLQQTLDCAAPGSTRDWRWRGKEGQLTNGNLVDNFPGAVQLAGPGQKGWPCTGDPLLAR